MKIYFGQQEEFTAIDNLLKMLTKYSFETYRDSYVRKQYKIPTEHPIYYVVKRLHYLYKTECEPIKMQHVRLILDTTPPYILDSMLYFFSSYGFYPPVAVCAVKNEKDKEHVEDDSKHVEDDSKHVEDDSKLMEKKIRAEVRAEIFAEIEKILEEVEL